MENSMLPACLDTLTGNDDYMRLLSSFRRYVGKLAAA